MLTDLMPCRRWANNLITLQPKCKIDPLLIENALCIFDAYCRAAQEQVSLLGCPFTPAFPPFPGSTLIAILR
jgi:hypothetical protein